MNGTSGLREVRSSISRLPSYRLLHEQRHQLGTGAWHLLHTHDPIALSAGITTMREKVPETISMLSRLGSEFSNFLKDREFADQLRVGRKSS